jgi:two-component system, NarL family, nitrate/nitrite response regulator NarL
VAFRESSRATRPNDLRCPPDTTAIRPGVFILSDVRLLCEGLLMFLSQQSSMEVLGSGCLSTPLGQIAEAGPDVLLVDIATSDGLRHAARCRRLLPNLKIVVISVAELDHEIFACAQAGVSGFVLRDGSIEDIVAAVHNAIREELVCSPRMAAALFGQLAGRSGKSGAAGGVSVLTRREHEIMCLVGEGLSNKEIARLLRLENSTVKNHMHHVLGKLQIKRRGEIVHHLRAAGPPAVDQWRDYAPSVTD